MEKELGEHNASDDSVRVIKRYANRKLYDMRASSYVTLDEIAQFIRDGEDLRVIDNKTKEDLTAVTLTQIIFEAEKKKHRVLPLSTLRGVIQSGGDFFQKRIADPVQSIQKEAERTMALWRGEAERTINRLKIDGIDDLRGQFTELADKLFEEFQRTLDERILPGSGNLPHQLGRELEMLKSKVAQLEAYMKKKGAAAKPAAKSDDEDDPAPPKTTSD